MKLRKADIVATIFLVAILVGAVGYFSYQGGYYIGLSERLDLNRPSTPEVYGHLYVFVMRGGEEQFTLAWSEGNVITNAGRNWIRDCLANQTFTNAGFNASHYLAIGTGSGGGASSTTLVTEFDRQVGTYAEPTDYNWTLTYTWSAGSFSGESISEAGCINLSSAGTLLNYQDFTAITLSASDSLQVQYEFMVTSGT